jgi:hypothetical protein
MPNLAFHLAITAAVALVAGCRPPGGQARLSPAERAALGDSVLTFFDSLSAIHTTHPDSALLSRIHPADDTLLFVEAGRIERFTGDSLVRRVLAMHAPVTSMAQSFSQRSALLFDRHTAWVTAVESVSWTDTAGPHDYRGVLTLALVRRGGRWVIRAYHG